jgi:hypothetical protein
LRVVESLPQAHSEIGHNGSQLRAASAGCDRPAIYKNADPHLR